MVILVVLFVVISLLYRCVSTNNVVRFVSEEEPQKTPPEEKEKPFGETTPLVSRIQRNGETTERRETNLSFQEFKEKKNRLVG